MKHAFSDENRGIRDHQAAILTAIESQTKAVISTMSTGQASVTGMDEEVRDLRKDLETLRSTCAKSRVTYTLNSLPAEGEDTEYGVGKFEVGKTGPPSEDRAEALGNTQIHLHATNTTRDADVAGLAKDTARTKDSTVKSSRVRLRVSPSPSSKDPGDEYQLDGPGPAQCAVQFSDHISAYVGTSSAPLGLENGIVDLDSSEINVCIASMAMTPTSERQKDRHIFTPDDDESGETLKPSEADKIDPNQSTDESRTRNDIDSYKIVDCVVHNLDREPFRGNDRSHPSDDAVPSIIQDFGRVSNRANRPWQVHHSTSTWTENQKSDLDLVLNTGLSELRNIDSETAEEVWPDGLDGELAKSASVATSPHYLLSSAKDPATVDMDTYVSSGLDRLNSGQQRSPISGSDSDMSLSTRCTDENSGVVKR